MNKSFLRCLIAVAIAAPCAVANAQAPAVPVDADTLAKAMPFLQAAVECKAPLPHNAAVAAVLAAAKANSGDIAGTFSIFGLKASKIGIFIGEQGEGESYSAIFDTATLTQVAKAAKLNKDGRHEFKGKHLESSEAMYKSQLACVVNN